MQSRAAWPRRYGAGVLPNRDAHGPEPGDPALPARHQVRPDRPVIAILPFVNLSGDPDQDYFARSLTEEVLSAFVRERWPVIVVNAADGAAIKAPASFNAQYVARGSVRRAGQKARVIAHLADASLGRQLWSAQVETEANSLFDLHDQLREQIVGGLAAAVSIAEVRRVARKPVESLTAYDLYLRASDLCRRGPEENRTAVRLLRRAMAIEPDFAPAYALAARCLHLRRLMGWSSPNDAQLHEAIPFAHRALQLDDSDPEVLWMSGLAIANVDGNLRDGKHLVERSLAVNRSNASAWIASSFVHANLGEPSVAIEHFNRAQRVNPEDGSQHLQWHAAATAYFIAGRHEEADIAADKALAQRPGYPGTLRLKIATAGLLGQVEAAHKAARRLAMVNRDPTLAYVRKYWELWPNTQDAVAKMLNGWRRAGMPEG